MGRCKDGVILIGVANRLMVFLNTMRVERNFRRNKSVWCTVANNSPALCLEGFMFEPRLVDLCPHDDHAFIARENIMIGCEGGLLAQCWNGWRVFEHGNERSRS